MTPILLLVSLTALPPMLPVTEVERGQRGTCLTVFEGNEIEPFDFEVKGVMEGFLGPGKPVVLVKLLGEKPEFTGVVSGMSGSPCSIDGKLVGALAYAFAAFAKEPIAGITPIAHMLEIFEQPVEARPWRSGSTATIDDAASSPRSSSDDGRWRLSPVARNDDAGWTELRAGRATPSPQADGLAPIATPLSLGGILPRVRDHFTPWLRTEGFVPVAGSLAGTSGTTGAALAPGSAIAAVLARGDIEIAATGTVTTVDGDRVTAFGHPFLGVGLVSVPMAQAMILNTMVSQLRSFKMSQVTKTVGEITQDRLTGIAGRLGPSPPMIPVRGEVETRAGKRTFAFDVARDQSLSPRIVAIGLANALEGGVAMSGRGTLRLNATVAAKGLEPVMVRSVHAAQRDSNLLISAAIDLAQVLATLWDTPFGPPPELAIELHAELEPEPIVEWIEAIHLDRSVAKPGEGLEIAVRLRREDGPNRLERFHLQIPRNWAGQEVDLFATGGDLAQQVAEGLAGDPRPTDLKQVGRWLRERRLPGHLYLLAARDGPGIRAGVDTRAFLPPSVVAILSGDPNTQARTRGLAWEERRAQPGVLLGGVRSSITVLPH